MGLWCTILDLAHGVGHVMKIRLMRKLAEAIDGVDLADRSVGDVFEVPDVAGRLLLAEGWAISDSTPQELKQYEQRPPAVVGPVGGRE